MAIVDDYQGVGLDIDGVLMRGETAIPGAAETVATLRASGTPLALLTNNARRTPTDIARWLDAAGIGVEPELIVTSALAASAMLEPGTRCLMIGMAGLREALASRDCELVTDPAAAEAVVVGFDDGLVWEDLRRATVAIGRGARFIGTNGDPTLPVEDGEVWPGNGAVLAALTTATGRDPEIAGKPNRPVFDAAASQLGDGSLLMVGDRIETDIAGASAAGWDTALVLTGVSGPDDAERADPAPTHVLTDVRQLLESA